MKQKVLFLFITLSVVSAQSTWIWSNRVHPELKWETISTKNYNIHYHQGIESIAEEGAIIAERVHPTLLEQMDVDSIPYHTSYSILFCFTKQSHGFPSPLID